MILTWQTVQIRDFSQGPKLFVVLWSTLYANFDTQKLIKSAWLRRSRSGKKVYQLPQFILQQKVSETTVWSIRFAFSERPNLIIYLPIGDLWITLVEKSWYKNRQTGVYSCYTWKGLRKVPLICSPNFSQLLIELLICFILWQHLCFQFSPAKTLFYPAGTAALWQRCHNVVVNVVTMLWHENESCGDVGLRRCENPAFWRCQDVAKTLLQRRHNIKHLVSRPFYYGQLGFFPAFETWKNYKSTWVLNPVFGKREPTLINSWLCLLLVCEQDKVATLGAKVAMKGLGTGKKCPQYNIVDLFPYIPTVLDRWSLHGDWTWNTHTQKY